MVEPANETRQAKRARERLALARNDGPGRLPDSMAPAAFGRVRALLRKLLGRRGPDSAVATAAAAAAAFDLRAQPLLRKYPVACRRGCSYCCHGQQVPVSAPEALEIAAHIRTRPAERRHLLAERLVATDRRTRGRSRAEIMHEMLPCPFLLEGECGIYPVRPLACRAFVSLDLDPCKRGFSGEEVKIPSPSVFAILQDFAVRATAEAAGKVGLAAGRYELHAAVFIALADDQAEKRWLAGEDLFADAVGHATMGQGIDRTRGVDRRRSVGRGPGVDR